MRFIRQRDNYSCGPIAVINALKWSGLSITYKSHFKEIKSLCKTTSNYGTLPYHITFALLEYKDYLLAERKELITLKEIESHLNENGAIILEYYFKENGGYEGHYALIFKKEDFIVVNDMDGNEAINYRKNIKSLLRCKKFRNMGSPSAWFLTRKN